MKDWIRLTGQLPLDDRHRFYHTIVLLGRRLIQTPATDINILKPITSTRRLSVITTPVGHGTEIDGTS